MNSIAINATQAFVVINAKFGTTGIAGDNYALMLLHTRESSGGSQI